MRNLKKFLALVMAMVMALSLMVSASAATTNVTYKDSDQVEPVFAEAVTILSGMGVFHGDENGFRPASSITRGEVAAIIYRLATGDVNDTRAGLYTTYSPFTDVAESDWFAGYVGYCWNAGYIKGTTATTYNPYDDVTGYEVLAMVLRAIGYDKNHEFEGAQWIVRVSSLATELGILKDIKTTHYADTLYLASRRDVVASMLFRAANDVATVNYTAIAGYNKYQNLVDNVLNPTLGWMNFGLTNDEGILVGNQDTGETNTRLSLPNVRGNAYEDQIYSYVELRNVNGYQVAATTPTTRTGTGSNNLNWIVTFDWTTGLEDFAHQKEVWFDGRNTYAERDSSITAFDDNNVKTYAMFDRSTNTAVVCLDKNEDNAFDANALKVDEGLATSAKGGNTLYTLAKDKGFTVGSNTTAYMNEGFDRFLPDVEDHITNADSTINAGNANDAVDTLARKDEYNNNASTKEVPELVAPEALYLMISNSDNKALDVVIGLNLQTTEVTGVDNVNTIPTVSVPFVLDDSANAAQYLKDNTTGWAFIDEDNILTTAADLNDDVNTGTLEQKQLIRDSVKTLGDYTIGVRVEGTAMQGGTTKITSSATSSSLAAGVTLTAGAVVATPGGIGDAGYEYKRADGEGLSTNAPDDSNDERDIGWFYLKPITNTVDVTIAYYNDKGVTTTEGKFYEYSMIYHTVVPNTLPQPTEYDKDVYRLYLTDDGKVLGAKHTYGNKFLYGTYVDYGTVQNSSTFNYTMVYVDMDGKTGVENVAAISKLVRDKDDNSSADRATVDVKGTNELGVPFRNANMGVGNANYIDEGVYRGFVYSGTTANWTFQGLANQGIVAGANIDTPTHYVDKEDGPFYNNLVPEVIFDGDNSDGDIAAAAGNKDSIVIDSDAVGLGAAYAGRIDVDGQGNTNAQHDWDDLYFTENTKFILVSGFGTDNVKAEVFNGIKDLKGSSSKVYIDLHYAVDNTNPASERGKDDDSTRVLKMANIKDDTLMSDMTYFTQSPFLYAQNRVLSRQADTIILPAAAVSRSTSSDTYYVGKADPIQVNAYGEEATQFAMYQKGVEKKIWVEGLVDNTVSVDILNLANPKLTDLPSARQSQSADIIADTGHDHFYKLVATTKKANDGETIYKIDSLTNLDWTQNTYVASTYSAQTGSFTIGFTGENRAVGTDETLMKNVGTCPIVNLNLKNSGAEIIWPGITDLTTLNYAGSLGNYQGGQYGGETPLYVSARVDGLTVTELYVCYDQTTPTLG